jgi:uncharacterized protein YceK
MKTSLVTIVISAAVLLTGCASTLKKMNAPKLQYTEYAGEPVKSFYMRNHDGGWSPVSKDQLVVWSGINEAYLIQVAGYCPDLMFAQAIGVTNSAGTVDKFEKVIVGGDKCFIKEIRPIDTKQMKADRKLLNEQLKKEGEES